MPRRKNQHTQHTRRGPQIPILQNWHHIRPSDKRSGDRARQQSADGDDLDIVDRAADAWDRRDGGEVSCHPGLHVLGGGRTHGEFELDGLAAGLGVRTEGGWEEEHDGCCLETELGEVGVLVTA